MKIIDILNKMANGTLEDGFEFCHGGYHFAYFKKVDEIQKIVDGRNIGEIYELDRILNNEVEVIEEEIKEIDTINAYKLIEAPYLADCLKEKEFNEAARMLKQSELEIVERINDLVYAAKELIKEREEKKNGRFNKRN